jgi:hypothetical protein
MLSTSYKILLNILLSRLSSYIGEIIGYRQCGFRRYRSTTGQIFYIRQITESASELHRPSDRRLQAKLVPNLRIEDATW